MSPESPPLPEGFAILADAVRRPFGDSVAAVILYGSCLRTRDLHEGIADLYVLLDRYPRAGMGWLPPSVYYLETAGTDGQALRCKYAVITLSDFEAGTGSWFHSYLWARFAQPVRVLYTRDAAAGARVERALDRAAFTFLAETIPVAGSEPLEAEPLWQKGLELTYGAELRPEPGLQAARLARDHADHCARQLAAAASALADRIRRLPDGRWQPCAGPELQRRHARRWLWRRCQGKLLSVLRWLKGAVTFSGGVDYAAWKIERHTGVRIEVTERLRRHPLVFGWPVLWRLWRRGALK